MINSPDVWISLRALPSPAPIDQPKQSALQSAYCEFAQLGFVIRNEEMEGWAGKLGQPAGWPLVTIGEDVLLHWEPTSVVLSASAVRTAAANAVARWDERLINAVGVLMDAGVSVVAVAPRARRTIVEAEDLRQWIRVVIDPSSSGTGLCSPLQNAA